MSDRKQQILKQGVELIATQGYGAFSMRAVARASGLTLGALQYHYRTQDALLRALAAHITQSYRQAFEAQSPEPSLESLLRFVLQDAPGEELQADRLFPQLWAMALVEPVMEELMDALYQEVLELLEGLLVARGARAPRAEALAIMGLLEGQVFFVGRGRRWAERRAEVHEEVLALIGARYGGGAP